MKIADTYYYNTKNLTTQQKEMIECLEEIFESLSTGFDIDEMEEIRNNIMEVAESRGWISDFKLPNSNLKITLYKNQVGICVQFGNVARTYCDILKIEQLLKTKIISIGILCVPMEERTKKSSTYASYEKLCKDIETLSATVSGPIICLGLW